MIRFKARRPVTLAFMAVDWEENLGLGSERNRGQSHFPGDAGIVAVVQDAAGKTVSLTDASWRAQTFYVAPLADRACLVENGALRDSSACSTRGSNDGSGDAAAIGHCQPTGCSPVSTTAPGRRRWNSPTTWWA